jgi:hypothetical protein
MKDMGHHPVVATLWTSANPERTTAKRHDAFSQKRSGSERTGEFSSLPVIPADPPERRRLRYENKTRNAMKTTVCGK